MRVAGRAHLFLLLNIIIIIIINNECYWHDMQF